MKDDKRKIQKINVNGNSTLVITTVRIQIHIKIPEIPPNHPLSLTFSFTFYLPTNDFVLSETETWDKIIKNPLEISGRFRYKFQGKKYQSGEYLLHAYLNKKPLVRFLPSLESNEKGSETVGCFIALILEELRDKGWKIPPSPIIINAVKKMRVGLQPSSLNLIMNKYVRLITGIQDEMVQVIEALYPHQEEKKK